MSAQNLDHLTRRNRKVWTPRPGWSYRGARRNDARDGGVWGYLPPDARRRRRITGSGPP